MAAVVEQNSSWDISDRLRFLEGVAGVAVAEGEDRDDNVSSYDRPKAVSHLYSASST